MKSEIKYFALCFLLLLSSLSLFAQQKTIEDTSILNMTCRELCQQIKENKLTSTIVLEVLHAQHQKHHPRINALAINLFDEAFATAKLYDSLASQGIFVGPLHGLPISIKENFDIKGQKTTFGIYNPNTKEALDDADLVKILKNLGAIVIGKSNVSQAMISADGNNSIYGQTLNPWNEKFATGGSSSGEGALIASGQSFAGIGTDLGGSIRFPAGFCGIAGFKPTSNALPHYGMNSCISGQNSILTEAGPMARHVDDLIFIYENVLDAIASQKNYGNNTIHITDVSNPDFEISKQLEQCNIKNMRIGYYKYDGFIQPAPALVKALNESIEILKNQGAEMIEIPCPNQKELVKLYFGLISADRQNTIKARFKYEKNIVPQMKDTWRLVKLPKAFIPLIVSILKAKKEYRVADVMQMVKKKNVYDLWKMNDALQKYRFQEMQLWNEHQLDAVICPASAMTGVERNVKGYFSLIFSYYGRYNLFGFPAGVVPMRFVQKDELEYTDVDDMITKSIAATTKNSEGMPAAVQVVALPWQDYKALYLMRILEENRITHFQYPF
jgi:fatty acid amide hydrolase